ncbi:MAG: DUF3089 domain-containing protein [Myxococcales bacterium]|nr:DUF3089 domain-containing protein [Myxococcales bacterium]
MHLATAHLMTTRTPIQKLFSRAGTKARIALGWLSFATRLRPKTEFGDRTPPPAPDYSDRSQWAVHPEAPNKSDFKPLGRDARDRPTACGADVFFIHPTSYFGARYWNAPLDHAHANELVDELIIPGQASVFNDGCRIVAPRYRQATFYSFLRGTKSGRAALELAYTDVLDAFEHYLRHWNQGRPFFIGSHSQGTVHAMRLLKERIDGTDLAERTVAAYAIGFRFPQDQFENGYFKSFHPSRSAIDTRCIVAWDTYSDEGGPSHWIDRAEVWYANSNGTGTWVRRAHKRPVATNPLSWTNDTRAVAASANKGAVHVVLSDPRGVRWKGFGGENPIGLRAHSLSAPHVGEVSATLREDGFLYVSWPITKAFTTAIMPGGNFHNYDYGLFYMNMRENVRQRLDVYLQQQAR